MNFIFNGLNEFRRSRLPNGIKMLSVANLIELLANLVEEFLSTQGWLIPIRHWIAFIPSYCKCKNIIACIAYCTFMHLNRMCICCASCNIILRRKTSIISNGSILFAIWDLLLLWFFLNGRIWFLYLYWMHLRRNVCVCVRLCIHAGRQGKRKKRCVLYFVFGCVHFR